MTARHALVVSLLGALLACAGCRERRLLPAAPLEEPNAPADTAISPPAGSMAAPGASQAAGASPERASAVRPPPASEMVARALLAEQFRRAGYRVRYDVTVGEPGRFEFTVDGYDPEARVGYEYIALEERETDLVESELRALANESDYRILVLDAAAPEALTGLAEAFLDALPARD